MSRLTLLITANFVSFLSLCFLFVFFNAIVHVLLEFAAFAHCQHVKFKFKNFSFVRLRTAVPHDLQDPILLRESQLGNRIFELGFFCWCHGYIHHVGWLLGNSGGLGVRLLGWGTGLLFDFVELFLQLLNAFVLRLHISFCLRVRIDGGWLDNALLHHVNLFVDETHLGDKLVIVHVERHYFLVQQNLVRWC